MNGRSDGSENAEAWLMSSANSLWGFHRAEAVVGGGVAACVGAFDRQKGAIAAAKASPSYSCVMGGTEVSVEGFVGFFC